MATETILGYVAKVLLIVLLSILLTITGIFMIIAAPYLALLQYTSTFKRPTHEQTDL